MVGDIKQSIYGFRLAEPDIFRDRYKRYALYADEGIGRKIDLNTNFRSKQSVIDTVNDLFGHIMPDYDEDAMLYKGYYIRPQTELDWNLSSFGTVFFKYKDKEMWCTTLVGQGSEDMIGFNHPGLSDEFELWAKTNPAKKDELFPNLENVINDYYKWREDKK